MALQNLMKQRDLPFGRALPIELLGVALGLGTRESCGKKVACSIGEPARCDLGEDASHCRCADDIGDPCQVGDYDRGAACHAFQ